MPGDEAAGSVRFDECFVGMCGVPGDLAQRADRMRERVQDWIGIPASVGIAPTKTLAKLANHVATAETSAIVQAAVRGLRGIYAEGYRIHKAGVILTDLRPAAQVQQELALDSARRPRDGLMAALDRLNDRYGRGAVQVASAGLGGNRRGWVMKQEWLTPQYTTDWEQLPVARA